MNPDLELIAKLQEDLKAANFQNDELKKALLCNCPNCFYGRRCAEVTTIRTKYMPSPSPWTNEQKAALAEVAEALHKAVSHEKPINEQCWCASKTEAKDAVCPVHDTEKRVEGSTKCDIRASCRGSMSHAGPCRD